MNPATQIEWRQPLVVTFRMSPPRLRQEELEVSLSYTHQVQGQPRLYNKNLFPETKQTEGKEKLVVCCMDGRVQQASAQFPLWRLEGASGSPSGFPSCGSDDSTVSPTIQLLWMLSVLFGFPFFSVSKVEWEGVGLTEAHRWKRKCFSTQQAQSSRPLSLWPLWKHSCNASSVSFRTLGGGGNLLPSSS